MIQHLIRSYISRLIDKGDLTLCSGFIAVLNVTEDGICIKDLCTQDMAIIIYNYHQTLLGDSQTILVFRVRAPDKF